MNILDILIIILIICVLLILYIFVVRKFSRQSSVIEWLTLILVASSVYLGIQTLEATKQALGITKKSLDFTQESLDLTKSSLGFTKESLDLTKESLIVNKETLKEALKSGSYNKKRQIYSITKYNCEYVVEHGMGLEEDRLMTLDFIIEPYIEDMDFIYNEIGEDAVEIITENLDKMVYANNYIYTLKELNIIAGAEKDPQTLSLIKDQLESHNAWIRQHSKEIKDNFCYKLLEAQNAPLRKSNISP